MGLLKRGVRNKDFCERNFGFGSFSRFWPMEIGEDKVIRNFVSQDFLEFDGWQSYGYGFDEMLIFEKEIQFR